MWYKRCQILFKSYVSSSIILNLLFYRNRKNLFSHIKLKFDSEVLEILAERENIKKLEVEIKEKEAIK